MKYYTKTISEFYIIPQHHSFVPHFAASFASSSDPTLPAEIEGFIFQDIKKKAVATEFYFRLIAVMTMSTKTIILRWQDPVFDKECSGKLRVGLMRDPRTGGN